MKYVEFMALHEKSSNAPKWGCFMGAAAVAAGIFSYVDDVLTPNT